MHQKWLLVLPIHSYRGAERVAINLAQGLAQSGDFIDLFFFLKDKNCSPIIKTNNIKIHYPHRFIQKLLYNPYLFTIFAPVISIFYLNRLVKQADIVQTESYPCFLPSLFLSKIYKKKIGWIIHDISSANTGGNFIQRSFHRFIFLIYNHLVKYIDLIITVSPKTNQTVKQLFPQNKIEMILPPVNFSRLDNSIKNFNKAKKILLTVGAIHPLKNQQLALESLSLLKKAIQDLSLIIIGAGDTTDLVNLCAKLHLSTSFLQSFNHQIDCDVLFTGFISDDQIKNYYELSDLVLITSLSEGEGLNITGFEALYLNKLCLATQGAGISQIFTENQIGLVSSSNPTEYAAKIKEYLNNPSNYTKMIEKGHQYSLNNLSIYSYAKKIINAYSTIHTRVTND